MELCSAIPVKNEEIMRKYLKTLALIGIFLFSYHHIVKPVAKGAAKVSKGVYHAVV
jgi:hypothetical protein